VAERDRPSEGRPHARAPCPMPHAACPMPHGPCRMAHAARPCADPPSRSRRSDREQREDQLELQCAPEGAELLCLGAFQYVARRLPAIPFPSILPCHCPSIPPQPPLPLRWKRMLQPFPATGKVTVYSLPQRSCSAAVPWPMEQWFQHPPVAQEASGVRAEILH
jgi:hypothetical protein